MKYYIITYGCQMNISDSERIAAVLEKCGLKKTETEESADLIVVNVCSVRQSAVDRALARIQNLATAKMQNANKTQKHANAKTQNRANAEARKADETQKRARILVTGCVLEKDRERLLEYCDGIFKIDELADNYLEIKPKYQSKIIAYVPIMTGCNNFCSYCVVPYLRNREISRPPKDIIDEIKCLVKNGVKEIWLLGQNVNSYKYQITNHKLQINPKSQIPKIRQINFAALLKMVNDIPGEFWIRFMSSHPKDLSKKLIETFSKCQKVTPFLNLPIQSGNNSILKKMNRHYTVNQYKELAKQVSDAFQKNRDGLEKILAISTDVIVGFPGETQKQFQNTVTTFKDMAFSNAFISRYSPRPQTAAFKLKDDVPNIEKKERDRALTKVVQESSLAFNKKFLNKIVDVLVLEKHKDFYIGRTRHNQTLRLAPLAQDKLLRDNLIGKFVKVKVIKAMHYGLAGKITNPKHQITNKHQFSRPQASNNVNKNLPKLIVIVGPTASGKSGLAVELAKKFNGEIISADSRQVYKGMDIGTGKITKKEMQGVPHYLLDVVSPKKRFDVSQYQKLAQKAINEIIKKGKLPIICGGTGFYIQSVVDGLVLPQVKPNLKLRKKLEKLTTEKLFALLKKKDAKRSKNIDRFNRRRLIRALEIVLTSKKPVPILKKQKDYDVLIMGVKKDKNELKTRIQKRLLIRLRQGMIKEIQTLRKDGLSWKKLEDFGLEYKFIALYLQKKISYEQMKDLLQKAIEQYAKRQMTWFKKDKRIVWIKNKKETLTSIHNFL